MADIPLQSTVVRTCASAYLNQLDANSLPDDIFTHAESLAKYLKHAACHATLLATGILSLTFRKDGS